VDNEVSATQIGEAARRLGLAGAAVCVHASLRSFPKLAAGPETLVDGLLSIGATVMVAAMAGGAFGVPAPPDDRPARNAIDYADVDRQTAAAPWPGLTNTFSPASNEVDGWLGATSAYVAARPDRIRSPRTGTFAAVGPVATALIGAEDERDVFGPLRALRDRDGWVLLAGVDLTKMTLLHLAEIEAGRRPFIRWMRAPDGSTTRVRVGECSMGFERLAPALAAEERRTTVGASTWRAYPAGPALERAASAIRADPAITRCPASTCQECADAIAGGPIEPPDADERRHPS
jgi:aminoglycoside 3-N-acetyltransferase